MTETENILETAMKITSGDRQDKYGHPRDNFGSTADLWNAYLKRRHFPSSRITAHDVGIMMILVKISREANNPTKDNLVDIAGYARTVEMLSESDCRPDGTMDPKDDVLDVLGRIHRENTRV